MINNITGKSNERIDVISKQEYNLSEVGDDKLGYKMAQLLKPGMLNFEPRAFKRPELDQSETLKSYRNSTSCYRRKRGSISANYY